ncbi:MAG: hypothetical protein H6523_12950 [Mycolicibacterium sp.]|nr:hypothetical protein [Mycolicibacterium sp.]
MRPTRTIAVAATAVALLAGCGASHENVTEPAFSVDSNKPTVQSPGDPISELLSLDHLGVHCFRSAADAASAQGRADRAAKRQNTDLDASTPEGELRPSAPHYLYVSDLDASGLCYTVTSRGLG